MELCSMLCASLDGRGVGGEWIHVYVWLSSPDTFTVHWILSQHCESAIPQYKIKNFKNLYTVLSVQFSHSVVSDSLRLSMDCSTPGLPVHHQLPKFTQTHIHWVSDAIQPSHPLSSPSPPAFNHSQHQGPFKWVGSLHQVAKVLEFQLQHQSFQWIFRTDSL